MIGYEIEYKNTEGIKCTGTVMDKVRTIQQFGGNFFPTDAYVVLRSKEDGKVIQPSYVGSRFNIVYPGHIITTVGKIDL